MCVLVVIELCDPSGTSATANLLRRQRWSQERVQQLLLRRSPDRIIFTVGATRFRCGAHVWSSLARKVRKARQSATTASERHFVLPVGHGVIVPICPYLMLSPSLEPSDGAA